MTLGVCWLALALSLWAMAGDAGLRAQLIGGTVAAAPAGGDARLDFTGAEELRLQAGKTEIRIPYRRINQIEYGQTVGRRYAAAILISPMLLLSKTRKHFVTLGYGDEEGRQQALVLRVGKGDIRQLLANLEARTGRRVEYQDEEARKAGRG
jgi:hypothetical protein